MRQVAFLSAALSLWLFASVVGAAASEPARIALLIGNQAYAENVGPLKNPVNDINLLETVLKARGFKVRRVANASLGDMTAELSRHARRVRRAGAGAISFVYYSGHGAQDQTTRTNYLIPVDVTSTLDTDLWDRSLPLSDVIRQLKRRAANATHFVVFDACRNALKLKKPGVKAVIQSKGFVPVSKISGMLIAFATAQGETASDVGDGAGPYARALAEELAKPGVEAVTMFRNVQLRLFEQLGQEPWLNFGVFGRVYFSGKTVVPPVPPQNSTVQQSSNAARDWRNLELATIKDRGLLKAFIAQYETSEPLWVYKAKQRLAFLAQPKPKPGPGRKPAPVPTAQPEQIPTRCDGIIVGMDNKCIKPGSGKSFRDCRNCPEMVVVPAGRFVRGSPGSEKKHVKAESPQHRVTIAKPFAVGKFEVTFDEWDACVADGGCTDKPSDKGWGRGRRPVINVSWNDITKQYLPWLRRKTGKSYRLLSETEWEYAARAGTATPFWWGASVSTSQANYDGNYTYGGSKGEFRKKTLVVGSFKPNDFGIYNVHGNVWEWGSDCWNKNYSGAPATGTPRTKGDCTQRVLRGGSWFNGPQYLRAAGRARSGPDLRSESIGFRVARTLRPPQSLTTTAIAGSAVRAQVMQDVTLRASPNRLAPGLGDVRTGDIVKVLERPANSVWVKVRTSSNKTGYIKSAATKILSR